MGKVGQFLDRCIAYLGNAGAAMGVTSIVIMTLIVTLNVILRYGLNKPLHFVEEYSAYLFILMAYMGFAYTARQGAHVNVDILTRRLKKIPQGILELITTLFLLVLVSVYLRFGLAFFMRLVQSQEKSVTPYMTPLWIPAIPIWLGLGFLVLELVTHFLKTLNSLRKG